METNNLDYPGFPSRVPPRMVEIIYNNTPKIDNGEYRWNLVSGLDAMFYELPDDLASYNFILSCFNKDESYYVLGEGDKVENFY